jgi:hypothetical protein
MTTHEQAAQDLPLYALGTLADEDRRPIEEHLRECARCRFELHLLREDMSRLSLAGPELPITEEHEEPVVVRELAPMITLDAEQPGNAATRLYWLATIPVVLCLVLGAMVVQLRTQNIELNMAAATAKADLAAEHANSERARLADAILHDSATARFSSTSGTAEFQVMFDPSVHHAIAIASHLPRLKSPQLYQLWLIPVSGSNPVGAGSFVPDVNGNVYQLSQQLPADLQIAGFQITIEDRNNAIAPSGPAVYSGK